jgi:hypothetical protein
MNVSQYAIEPELYSARIKLASIIKATAVAGPVHLAQLYASMA